MYITPKTLLALPVLGLTVCLSQNASAALLADFQFNTVGDVEGWVINNGSGVVADGDSLNFTPTGNDSQALFGVANGPAVITLPSGAQVTTVVIRYRRTDSVDGVVSPHEDTGTIVQLFRPAPPNNNVVNISGAAIGRVVDTDGFSILTADFSPGGGNDYTFDADGIARLRVDVVGNATSVGDLIEIDYIQVFDDSPIPEPSSLALLGLGGLLIARRRRRG